MMKTYRNRVGWDGWWVGCPRCSSRGVWGRWSHPLSPRVVVSYQPTDPPAPIRASDTHTDFPDFGGILRIWVAVNLFLILCFLISRAAPRHPHAHSYTYTGQSFWAQLISSWPNRTTNLWDLTLIYRILITAFQGNCYLDCNIQRGFCYSVI